MHIYGTVAEEQFLACGIDDNGNIDVFVSIADPAKFNSLELWK